MHRLPQAVALERTLGDQEMHMHMKSQVAAKSVASGDDARHQFVPLAQALEALQGRRGRGMTGLRQQLAFPEEHRPQLARHTEHQVPVLTFDEPGLDAFDDTLSMQPATRRAQAAFAGEGDGFGFAAGVAAQADETCRGCATSAHRFQSATGRLPHTTWDAPGQGQECLVTVVLQDLLQDRGM